MWKIRLFHTVFFFIISFCVCKVWIYNMKVDLIRLPRVPRVVAFHVYGAGIPLRSRHRVLLQSISLV